MPKSTFFNLEPKKRKKIMNAAKKEFTRVPLDKVKISNIIISADIPRGSFYQYFENIDDLFYYFVEEVQTEREKILYDFALNNEGDIFEFAKNIFYNEYDEYICNKRHHLMMNIFKSISLNTEYVEKYNIRRKKFILKLLKEVDVKNLKFHSEDDLFRVFQLIQDQRRNLIHKSLQDKLTKKEAYEGYDWYINVLKNGLLKEELHE